MILVCVCHFILGMQLPIQPSRVYNSICSHQEYIIAYAPVAMQLLASHDCHMTNIDHLTYIGSSMAFAIRSIGESLVSGAFEVGASGVLKSYPKWSVKLP